MHAIGKEKIEFCQAWYTFLPDFHPKEWATSWRAVNHLKNYPRQYLLKMSSQPKPDELSFEEVEF